jgi:exosortase/archaeosortase family protein
VARDRLAAHVPAGPRLVAAILAVTVAYHFSLGTLASNWRYETPLADLVLVPPLAAALLFAASRRHPYVAFLRLGRFDLVIAAILTLSAIVLVAAGPTLLSKYFWAMRLDLLSLPLFASATVALLFGARSLVPLTFPLLFLLLAWPLPYLALLERGLTAFTGWTAWAVQLVVSRTDLAVPVAGSNTLYSVTHHGTRTVVGIATACSGVNSLVGFAVVGLAALWFVQGRFACRLAWLAAGAALVWSFNVVRIIAVFLVAHDVGAHAAFDLLHPVAGIVSLNLAFLILLRALPLFGLGRRRFGELEIVDSPLARTAPPTQQATPRRITVRLALLVVASGVLAFANGQLSSFARGYDNTGRPALAAFVDRPEAGHDWSVRRAQQIGWASSYFGRHSSWIRYELRPARTLARRQPFTVWADAVLSPDLGALDAYTLAHCYAFHGFRVDVARHLDLGNGVIGQLFVYRTSGTVWHALAWQWPVLRSRKVDHERIVLLASTITHPRATVAGRSGWLTDKLLGYVNSDARDDDDNRNLSRALTALATQMVAARVERGTQT